MHRILILALIATFFATPCVAEPISAYPTDMILTNAHVGEIHLTPCEFLSKPDGKTYAADCGTVVVPENHAAAPGRLLMLPVIRVRHTASHAAEPVFTFRGGPGSSNVVNFPIDALLPRHDVVMVGYRGADGSTTLDCPEMSEHLAAASGPLFGPAIAAAFREGARACAEGLHNRGFDLALYTHQATVDDQEIARKALGYGKIDLLGGSFGTRLEMTYMWRHPASLHRVVMIGVNPPGHFVWDPKIVDNRIARYGTLCAADAYCHSRTPDLAAAMRHVSAAMPTNWWGVPIDPDRVRFFSFFMLHETIDPGTAPLPLSGPAAVGMWQDTADGDASGMALVSQAGGFILPRMFAHWGHFLAMGAADYQRLTPQQVAHLDQPNAIFGSPSRLFWEMTRGWPRQTSVDYDTVQSSDIETLLISGTLDVTTPLEPARDELLPRLSRGHLVALAEFGHTATFWNSQPAARARLLTTFLDTGRIDSNLYRLQPLVFRTGGSVSGLAHRIVLVAALALAALIGAIWFVTVLLRRRRRTRLLHRA